MHVQTSLRSRRFLVTTLVGAGIVCAAAIGVNAGQSSAAEAKDQPYAIEYYYKAKWGHAEEFLTLFKKNHYPVLKKEMELGRMLKVSMVTPRYHMTEDQRWDYRVTILFKNAAVANDNFDSSAIITNIIPTKKQTRTKRSPGSRFSMPNAERPLRTATLTAAGRT